MADRFTLLNDAEAAVTYALDGRQSKMWTAMPAIVISVNWDQMTLQVQPAIQGVYTNEQGAQSYVTLPPLVDVPIVFPSAGGFSLTLPVAPGDEVLVVIASRCIDAWWQNGGVGVPMELRMHDLSDGFAIPGPKSLPNVVRSISPTNAQLRSNDGTLYLELTPEGAANIVAPAGVTITGNLTVVGNTTITENLTVDEDLTALNATITDDLTAGEMTSDGTITATGDISTSGDISGGAIEGTSVIAGGISLAFHIHDGVTPGSGNTGDPV